MTEMTAYTDESIRGNRYLMAVVVVDPGDGGGACRAKLRSQAKAFKKRSLHFNDLVPAQRTQTMDLFCEFEGVRSYVFEHARQRGEDLVAARAVVLTAMINRLQDERVALLVLDQWSGYRKDGEIIRRIQYRPRYDHSSFQDEPLLWIADGIVHNAGVKQPLEFPSWHEGTTKV